MSYPTKVQLIQRTQSSQWYITVPAVLARMLDFSPGEVIEWSVEDRHTLVLRRSQVPTSPLKLLSQKKKLQPRSSPKSTPFGNAHAKRSRRSGSGNEPQNK